jgi:hypothetical protein
VRAKTESSTQTASPADLYFHAGRLVSLLYTTERAIALLTFLSVCVASVMRIYYLQVLRTSTDVTYSMGNVFIWSSVEPAIGIVSLCLVSLRLALQRALSAVLGTTSPGFSSDHTKSHEQPFSPYDGRDQDDKIRLVCASSSTDRDPQTSNDRVIVTTHIDVDSKKVATENWPLAL